MKDSYTGTVIGDTAIYLSLDELVDRDAEIARLNGEKKKIEKELARIDGKLGNPGFLGKALSTSSTRKRKNSRAIAKRWTR